MANMIPHNKLKNVRSFGDIYKNKKDYNLGVDTKKKFEEEDKPVLLEPMQIGDEETPTTENTLDPQQAELDKGYNFMPDAVAQNIPSRYGQQPIQPNMVRDRLMAAQPAGYNPSSYDPTFMPEGYNESSYNPQFTAPNMQTSENVLDPMYRDMGEGQTLPSQNIPSPVNIPSQINEQNLPPEVGEIKPTEVNVRDILMAKQAPQEEVKKEELPPPPVAPESAPEAPIEAPKAGAVITKETPIAISPDTESLNEVLTSLGYPPLEGLQAQQRALNIQAAGKDINEQDLGLSIAEGMMGDVGQASTRYAQAAGTSMFGGPDLSKTEKAYENYNAPLNAILSAKQKMADSLRTRAADVVNKPLETSQLISKTLAERYSPEKARLANVKTGVEIPGVVAETTGKNLSNTEQVQKTLLEKQDNDANSESSKKARDMVRVALPSFPNLVNGMNNKQIKDSQPIIIKLMDIENQAKKEEKEKLPFTINNPIPGSKGPLMQIRNDGSTGTAQIAQTNAKLKTAPGFSQDLKALSQSVPTGGFKAEDVLESNPKIQNFKAALARVSLTAKNYYGLGANYTGKEVELVNNALGYNVYSTDKDGNWIVNMELLKNMLSSPSTMAGFKKNISKFNDNINRDIAAEIRQYSDKPFDEAQLKDITDQIVPSLGYQAVSAEPSGNSEAGLTPRAPVSPQKSKFVLPK